jgi:dienelactone hydrolase
MRTLLSVLVLGFVVSAHGEAPAARPAPALWGVLTPGPYGAGYRRLATDEGLAVHAWYPTEAEGRGLLVRDYLGAGADGLAYFLESTGLAPAAIDSLFDSPLYAQASPPALDSPEPLVLVAQGNGGDVFDQVILCEYLASQGFVVATTPSPTLRVPLESEDQVGAVAELQADDLAKALAPVAAAVPVDTLRLGVVGHSFGARAGLLLAMRDPRVRILISLDGGIGTATAVDAFRQAPSFRAEAQIPPLLHVYETLDAFMTPDFALLDSLDTEELVLEPTTDMHHVHFTTYGFVVGVRPDLAALTHATGETVFSAAGVAEAAAAFLRQYLE